MSTTRREQDMQTQDEMKGEHIRALPKAHLHLHFPRTIRPGTLRELAAREGISLDGFFEFGSLVEFLGRRPIGACITRPEDLQRICREMVEDAARDGVLYAEPMVVLHSYTPRFGTLDETYRLLRDAFDEAGADLGVEVGIMIGFNRHGDSVDLAEELARFAARRAGDGVTA
jgi:adenosine deaminase